MDETVALLETDKVTVDIKAPVAGVITKYFVAEGDNLEVGKPFFDIDPEAQGSKAEEPKEQENAGQKAAKTDEARSQPST